MPLINIEQRGGPAAQTYPRRLDYRRRHYGFGKPCDAFDAPLVPLAALKRTNRRRP
jgi:hypothetical protein